LKLAGFFSWFDRFETAIVKISSALLLAITVLVNVQVIFRYFIRAPLTWSIELNLILFTYLVFFSAAVALRRGSFATVTVLVGLLPPRSRQLIAILGNLLIAIFVTVGCIYTQELVLHAKMTSAETPALGIPMQFVYGGMQIGFALQTIFIGVTLLELLYKMTEEKRLGGV